MPPVFGGKVRERQQHFTVFFQAFCGLGVLEFVYTDKVIKMLLSCCFIKSHPDLMEFLFCFWLKALWQFIQNIGGFMHPASLPAAIVINRGEGFPEPRAPSPNGENKLQPVAMGVLGLLDN